VYKRYYPGDDNLATGHDAKTWKRLETHHMKLCLSGFLFERGYRTCDLEFPDFIAVARQSGFDGVELRRTQIHVGTPLKDVCRMRRIVDDHGVFVSCMESRGLPGEEPGRSDFFNALVERAALMGSQLIKIGASEDLDVAWYRQAADKASQHDIRLGSNNHVGSVFETVEGSQDVLRRVGHDGYGLLYDCLHLWVCGGDYVKAIGQLSPHVLNVIVHAVRPSGARDVPDITRDGGQFVSTTIDDPRSQDWCSVFAALRRTGYDGLVTVIKHVEAESLRRHILESYPKLIRNWWEQARPG